MKQRYFWIDNIRAIAMISMIIYHGVWDLVYLYGMDWGWYRSDLAFVWQQSICWTFILLSGFCWSFSKNPLKQGLIVSGAGIVVSIVTMIFSYESRIIFGVLSLIGTSALLMILLKKYCEKLPATGGFALMFFFFAMTYGINDGYLGLFGVKILKLPEVLYANLFTTFLGFSEKYFFSADYFSLFPWVFLYFAGYFLYRLWKEEKIQGANCMNRKILVLTWLGKKSLIVYMLHQPILYVLLELTFGS